jgi:hypothetical protein
MHLARGAALRVRGIHINRGDRGGPVYLIDR